MQPIQEKEELWYFLKNGRIVFTKQKGVVTYLALNQERIRAYNENAHYFLETEDFITLFEKEEFYLHEAKEEEFVSAQKDEEYYSWHKK